MKTLIAYFSRGGTTANIASQLQTLIGGDLFEVKGKKNYGSYLHAVGVARKEFSSGELPEVESDVKDFNSYDRFFIGFPIWYSKCPQLMISFLKSHDFQGKDVYPFCTSGMSGAEGAQEQIREACPNASVHQGIRLSKVDENEIKNWIGDI